MNHRIILQRSISSLLALGTIVSAHAANIWDGGGTTDLWSDVFNWDNNAFPGYGTLTFGGITRTTNIVDANINMNQLLWTGASAWTLNNQSGAVISLFDNGGVQAKVENQSTGLVTINAPITFAATAGAAWGEINAVNGGLTFGAGGTLAVSGSAVSGIRMFGAGQTTTFDGTVSAAGKYFATTAAAGGTVEIGGAFTSGDFYVMNDSVLSIKGGGALTSSAVRLGGDFGTTGFANSALGGILQLADTAGGQTFSNTINTVAGNSSGNLRVVSMNNAGTNTINGSIFLDSPLLIQQAIGGNLAITSPTFDIKAQALTVGGLGSTTVSSVISNSVVGGTITKIGAGTLTLNGANTFSGAVTVSGGTLNLGNAAALGTATAGGLVISASSILNNTSGGALSLSVQKGVNVNADLTFTGSNNLFIGPAGATLGTMTIGGAAGSRTINVAANTLGVGLLNSNAGIGLVKTGAGTLAMGFSSLPNSSTINGILDLQSGKVQMNSDFTVAGLSGAGTLENGGAASKWFFNNQNVNTTFSGSLSDGPTAGIRLGMVKRGTGTLNLTGNVNHSTTDRFSIENGGVRLAAGTYTTGFGTNANQTATVGSAANQNGVLIIDGGTFNANKTANPSLAIGSGANTRGFLQLISGTINSVAQVNIGNGSGAVGTRGFGAATVSGGILNSGSWLVVGANFDRAVLNQSGGTINVQTNRMTIGAGGVESLGVVNISGGTLNSAGGIFLGENGQGVVNLSGTGLLNTGTNSMQFAGNATSTNGWLNLNGGTLATGTITKGASNAAGVYRAYLNGGTIRATASSATFWTSLALTSAYVGPNGITFDTNGFNDTIAQPLLATAGNGLTSIPVAAGGAGYIDTPVITISGGGGTGATAVANVSGGVITSFTITNPGINYTSAPTITIFGGGATTAGTAGTATFGTIASGGLTKSGAGVLTMDSTTNSYGGATTISAGTLSISTIGNGGAASSLGASSNAAANLVLDGGTLQFTGATGTTDRSFTITTGKTGTIEVSSSSGTLTTSGGTAVTNGALTKTGLGILSITGTPAHTGLTTVSAGTLGLSGTASGAVSIGAGQLNALYNAVGALTVPALTFASTGGVNFDFGVGNDVITISNVNGLTLGTGSSLNLYNAGGVTPFTTNGTYTIFDYNTSYSGSLLGAFIVANSQPGKVYSIVDNVGATTIDLTIGTAVVTEWQTGSGLWSVNANWTAGSPNSIGATATFAALGTPPATVTVDGPKTVGNIVFNNAAAYTLVGGATDILTLNNGLGTATISAVTGSHAVNAPVVLVNPSAFNADASATLDVGGDVSGSVALTKTGAGTVILSGTNSYATTTVSAGTLQIGNGGTVGTLGCGAATLAGGTTLAFNRSNAYSLSNNISGGGILSHIGSGTTTYTGTATHTGLTNVTNGTLLNQGTINGTSGINVTGAGIFENSGSITVNGLTANSGGTASITGSGGGTVNGAIAVGTAGTGSSLTLNTTGTLTNAATSNLNVGVGAATSGSLTMTSGTLTQTGAFGIVIGANGGSGTYTQTGGTVNAGTSSQGFQIGVGTTGSTGIATISGAASVLNSPNEFWISNGLGNTGTMTMNAGAVNTGSWFVVGRDRGTGTLNLNGGTITKNGAAGNFIIIGSLGGTGTVNQTGGQLNATAGGIRMGENTGTIPALNGLWDMTGGSSTVNGEINIAWRSSQATWNVSGASTLVNATGRLIVGAETNNNTINTGPIIAGAPVGLVNISGGTVSFAGGDSRIGGDNSNVSVNATGTVNVSGTGVLNFGGNLQVGAFGKGFMNISGSGVVNSTASFPSVGRYAGSVGELNVNGGTFNQTGATSFLIIGEEGAGTLNLNSGLVDVENLRVGHATTGNGTVNLNGGTLATAYVQKSVAGSTAAFNFNGGTLKAKASSSDFLTGFSSAQIDVKAGGAVIDTNGFNDSITQGLNGVGGLIKQGTGTLTLSGASGYSGATVVNNGTLEVSGSILGSSGVTVNTGGTLLLTNSGDHIGDTAPMTLAGGIFNVNGFSETLGTLTLSENSIIDFGSGASILSLANSTGLWAAGKTLSIWNWSGTPIAGGGADQLRFSGNGLSASQLSQISFYSDAGVNKLSITPQFSENGFVSFGEVVPVPEPSSVITVLSLFGLAGWRERRRGRAVGAAARKAAALS